MFCKICGNELNEKAVICPKCGCAVEKVKPPKIKKEKNITNYFMIVKYITVILLCFAVMFMTLSIIYSYIKVNDGLYLLGTSKTGYDLYGSIYAYFYTDYEVSIPCLIFSILSYVFSAIGFALGFKKENKEKRFATDAMFIIANFILVLSIICISNAW